ncbi:lipoprotein-releasing ABC transporter ATP-binding protein LolD [Alteromonas gilva]|uniref:Lipoprotein-releasing system ATP-binding protein LolD n=1 Tax=Alteromonas gilva TaxID=2987522 RepID=A0ABT5L4G7_9ALTE|nr:lipoprotein-releasing ABC transporter ATP-binding protein LolD [Alteromonas gilva]MDC8831291.1 lipoprotein-releasing ABC transporter ATP-binding protein LolD [Alteromonas gilva]
MAEQAVLVCRDVTKTYHDGDVVVSVLNKVSFQLMRGEKVAILGSSGSGKSTLLHILGGLDLPTVGDIIINGRSLSGLSSNALATLRNRELGFIYQFHHLLAEFSAVENAAMPLLIAGVEKKQAEARAADLLQKVGLGHRLSHQPAALSGGERQRVAIARALVNDPDIVLADEPTGNLDKKTGDQIYQLLCELSEQMGTSFIVVTHDTALAGDMDRVMELTDGQLAQRQRGTL